MKKVTPRQERFAREYIIDLNGAAAARRVKVPARSAKVWASKQLALIEVQARIAELQKKIADKQEITAERVLNEIAQIAFRPIDGLGGVISCSDKTKSLEMLGKHLKLFTDKVEWLGDDSFVRILEAARQRAKS